MLSAGPSAHRADAPTRTNEASSQRDALTGGPPVEPTGATQPGVYAPAAEDRRRRQVAAEPFLPQQLARLRLDARGHALVVAQEQPVADEHRRRQPRHDPR